MAAKIADAISVDMVSTVSAASDLFYVGPMLPKASKNNHIHKHGIIIRDGQRFKSPEVRMVIGKADKRKDFVMTVYMKTEKKSMKEFLNAVETHLKNTTVVRAVTNLKEHKTVCGSSILLKIRIEDNKPLVMITDEETGTTRQAKTIEEIRTMGNMRVIFSLEEFWWDMNPEKRQYGFNWIVHELIKEKPRQKTLDSFKFS